MAYIYPKSYFGDKIIDTKDANLSIASSAILYGLSVYTVFPVILSKNKKLAFRLREHYGRLINSARIIGIDTFKPEWSEEKFIKAAEEIIKINDIKNDAFVRASVHVCEQLPGTRSRGLKTIFSIFVYKANAILPLDGARLKTSVWRRIPDYAIPSRAKVNGAYVNSVLAKQDALDSGYDDCIFLDTSGHVCELSAGNIFIVRDRVLITPAVFNDILEGISRKTVLELAADLGIKTIERDVDLTELYVADEVFTSGTSTFVAPVIEVDKRKINGGKMGPLTAKIQKTYLDILNGKDNKYSNLLTTIN